MLEHLYSGSCLLQILTTSENDKVSIVKKRKLQYYYPLYFDKTRSRGEGRRVNKNVARPNPSLELLVRAAQSLNLEFKVEPEKAHPKKWWEPGRIAIPMKEKKQVLLNKISRKLKSLKK